LIGPEKDYCSVMLIRDDDTCQTINLKVSMNQSPPRHKIDANTKRQIEQLKMTSLTKSMTTKEALHAIAMCPYETPYKPEHITLTLLGEIVREDLRVR